MLNPQEAGIEQQHNSGMKLLICNHQQKWTLQVLPLLLLLVVMLLLLLLPQPLRLPW